MTDDWYRIANEDEVASPALLVYPERIADNIVRMITAAGGAERLRPHVKTHKMPDVIRMEIERCITKFKVATIAEAEMTAAAGGLDVLLAYPVVGPAARRLARLAATHPRTTFRAITDSAVGIDGLAAAATAADVTLDVLLDLDVGFARTGIRPGPDAVALYRRIAAAPNLTAGGLHAYDGHLRDADHGRLVAATEAAFTPVWSLRSELRAAGFAVPRTVVSGTPTFAILAARDDVEVGAGTTVLWDAGQAEISPDLDFLPAAVLLARVVSKPGDGRLCLDLGHKASIQLAIDRCCHGDEAAPARCGRGRRVCIPDRHAERGKQAGEFRVGEIATIIVQPEPPRMANIGLAPACRNSSKISIELGGTEQEVLVLGEDCPSVQVS
jgi:D-serine deaminase-like pyridoxal phosphate-dependent protein